jgi:ATP-dependent RNA helicase DeaD
MQSLNNMGFEEPTPIQEEAIPAGLNGRDIIWAGLHRDW